MTVSRKVLGDDGKVLKEDSFSSRYIPEDAIYLVGKGATLPAGQSLAGLYPGYTGSTDGVDLAHWLGTPTPPKKKKPADTKPPAGRPIAGAPAGTGRPATRSRSSRRPPTRRRRRRPRPAEPRYAPWPIQTSPSA